MVATALLELNPTGRCDAFSGTNSNINMIEVDRFFLHFGFNVEINNEDDWMISLQNVEKFCLNGANIGSIIMEVPHFQVKNANVSDRNKSGANFTPLPLNTHDELLKAHIDAALANNLSVPLLPQQAEIFSLLCGYQDVLHPHHSLDDYSAVRLVYVLHILNHTLKVQTKKWEHPEKLKSRNITTENYSANGYVRPKSLIILPNRHAAYQVINNIIQLLYGFEIEKCEKNANIVNLQRFLQEFTGNTLHFSKKNPKNEDYEQTFSGNIDDNFRLGVSLKKKKLTLYSDFYSSDIIIASPLGLRLAIDTKTQDYDFLTSIEILVIEPLEMIYMQNWDNLLFVMDHCNLQPKSMRNIDLQNVQPRCLNGLSKFYRQTILFSSYELPEFRALFNCKCSNYEGKIRVSRPIILGNINNAIVSVPQTFQKFNVADLKLQFDERFQYFIANVLPRFKAPSYAHCMLYVPSYFDYIRIRNYMKAEGISFVQICEYSKKSKITRARDMFYHNRAHFLLYSERFHFFSRPRIKGIRHLIMYQPPACPNLYSEIVNLMHESNQNKADHGASPKSVTVLYSKYDIYQLNAILGSELTAQFTQSVKNIHIISLD